MHGVDKQAMKCLENNDKDCVTRLIEELVAKPATTATQLARRLLMALEVLFISYG